MFWFFAAALLILAALFILIPLWKFNHNGETSRSRRQRANLLIFKERIAELEGELAAGILEQENFESLQRELERSLLSDVQPQAETHDETQRESNSWRSTSRLVPLVFLLIIVPLSIYLYRIWGSQDELVLAQLFERTRESADEPQEVRDLIFSLGEIIEKDRENGWAWYFMAQNLVNLAQFPQAALALERASEYIEAPQDRVVVLGQYAFLEYMLAEQKLTDKVQGIIDQTQRLEPNQLLILQILGMDAEQRADYQAAITYWSRMLQMTPPGEEAQLLQGMIANAQQQLAGSNHQNAVAGDGPGVEVEISLGPDLALDPSTRVFVSALEVNGRGQPLAAEVLTVGDLPTIITLDDSDAVGPFNISSAPMIYIVATVSSSGSANVQTGDYQNRTEDFEHSKQDALIHLQITDIVP